MRGKLASTKEAWKKNNIGFRFVAQH